MWDNPFISKLFFLVVASRVKIMAAPRSKKRKPVADLLESSSEVKKRKRERERERERERQRETERERETERDRESDEKLKSLEDCIIFLGNKTSLCQITAISNILPTERISTKSFEQILPKNLRSLSVAHPKQMFPVTPLDLTPRPGRIPIHHLRGSRSGGGGYPGACNW